MRCVDADALLKECAECQKTDPHFEERGWANHFINNAGEPSTEWYCVEDMIENAPTVDAIPVEWLKAQNNSTKYFKTVQGQAAELILELWQKEQEARDNGG